MSLTGMFPSAFSRPCRPQVSYIADMSKILQYQFWRILDHLAGGAAPASRFQGKREEVAKKAIEKLTGQVMGIYFAPDVVPDDIRVAKE